MNKGLHGPRPSGPRPYGPQQVIIQPPKGYVPPLRNELTPIAVYNTSTGYWVGLPIEALVEALVLSEQKHILGILDGREEDYDKQTLAIVAAETIGTNHDASLTVPVGEVYFLNVVRMYVPATTTFHVDCNWYCDLWPDHADASPSGFGQSFYGAVQNNGVGGPWTFDAEFDEQGPLWAVTNKHVALRLPPGTVLKVRFTSRGTTAEAISCTFQLFGFIGKYLVG